jgi:signal transduction histidine kinase
MIPFGAPQFSNAVKSRLWWCFAVIVAGFALSTIVSIHEIRSSQSEIRFITKHAATNIESLSRLSHNLYQKHLLLEDHVFEKQLSDMSRIETEMANLDADISAAISSYELIGVHPEEQNRWQQVHRDILSIKPDIDSLLSLSRANRDRAAWAAIKRLEPSYQSINQATDALLDLNHARASQEAVQVRALQRYAVIFLAVLTVVWTAFALLTARWVTQLVTERENQLRRAVTLLEERNRELDAFAGRVAHDLRGPLTTISLAVSAFTQTRTPVEATTPPLRRSVAKMKAIIEDLLTLSRVSSELTGATCQTERVVALLREDLAPKVETIGGVLNIKADAAVVSCSEGLLRQVLWNLAENAVKYCRSEVALRVDIYGRARANAYEFTVSDNGTGMSASELDLVFEPFFRGEHAWSTPGTGLGLSIVKRVVEASGGTVSVDSVVGRGTTFRMQLPLAVSTAPAIAS